MTSMLASALIVASSAQVVERSRITMIEFEGADKIGIRRIEERLRVHGIVLRLGLPPENRTICEVKEVVADLMAERDFPDAEVTHDLAPLRGDARTLKLTFTIKPGTRSRQSGPSGIPLSPAERCRR